MSKNLLLLLLISLLLLNVFIPKVNAQDDTEEDDTEKEEVGSEYEEDFDEEDEGGVLGPAPDIETSFLFPDTNGKKLKLGSKVTLLMNMKNLGEKSFNITTIGGSLHSPFDYSYFIQNFSQAMLNGVSLGPNEETSLAYDFKPDESLEALEFWFSVWVRYNSTNEQFMSTIYNSTVELVTPSTDADTKRFFTYVLGTAAAILVAIIFFNVKSSVSESKTERGTRGGNDDVQIYKPAQNQKKVKSSSKKKKSKKSS